MKILIDTLCVILAVAGGLAIFAFLAWVGEEITNSKCYRCPFLSECAKRPEVPRCFCEKDELKPNAEEK